MIARQHAFRLPHGFCHQRLPAGIGHHPLQTSQGIPAGLYQQHGGKLRQWRFVRPRYTQQGAGAVFPHLYPQHASRGDPAARNHGRQGLRQIAMNHALQFPGAVFQTGSGLEQPLARFQPHFQIESPGPQAVIDVALQVFNLVIHDGRKRFHFERPIGHNLVNPVDELGREFAAHRAHTDALQLTRNLVGGSARSGRLKPEIRQDFA